MSPAPLAAARGRHAAPGGRAEPALLAGDVGGTKTMLALVTPSGAIVAEATYASRDFAGLECAVRRFRDAFPLPVSRASFSVAGPVIGGRASITHLPWVIDADALRRELALEGVHLMNDVQATAHAVPHLRPDQLRTLQPGTADPAGARAVVAVGTGLGEAMLVPRMGGWEALASEGGHTDFAPRTRLQRGLLARLQREYGHVSYERVCSGFGLPNLYRHLRARSGVEEPGWLAGALAAAEDPTPVIAAAGFGRPPRCPVCRDTLRVFAAILGAEAGNLALRSMATGGVYVGGGIPPRLLPVLRGRAFREGFLRKGPMSGLAARIPVHVILEPRAALLGAAHHGLAQA